MVEQITTQIVQGMLGKLNNAQLQELRTVVERTLLSVDIFSRKEFQEDNSIALLNTFISSKRIEGCSEKSLSYYRKTIETMIEHVSKPVQCMDTNDLRDYLTAYHQEKRSSKVTIDNIRRILSSFFSWLEDEDYIIKSPIRRIHKIKTAQLVKDTLSDENIEQLRDNCENIRDLSLIELLISTGMRVGEIVNINKNN